MESACSTEKPAGSCNIEYGKSQTCSNLYENSSNSSDSEIVERRSTSNKWTRHQKLTLATLLLVLFNGSVSYSLLAPFFPQEAKDRGASVFQTGLVFAVFQLVTFIMSPVYGYLIVQLRPKFMCVAGCFIGGGCCVLFGALSYTSGSTFFIMCLIVRAVEANGSAMVQVAALSQLMKTFPEEIATVTSYAEAISGFGCILGPLIGGGLYSVGKYMAPFAAVGGFYLICCLILMFLLLDINEEESQSKNFLKLITDPGIFIICLHCCLAAMVMSFLDPILSDWMISTFDVSVVIVTLIFSAWSASYAISAILIGKLTDRGYIYSQMILGMFMCSLCYLFFAPSPLLNFIFHGEKYLWLVIVISLIVGMSSAAIYVPPFQAACDLVEVSKHNLNLNTYGMVTGLMNSGYSLGAFIGPSLSGLLNDKYGFDWACTAAAAPMAFMGLIMSTYVGLMYCARKPLKPKRTNESNKYDKHCAEREETQRLLN